MPPRGTSKPIRKRQYEYIRNSELKMGRSEKVAQRIAAATVNKTKRIKKETKKK